MYDQGYDDDQRITVSGQGGYIYNILVQDVKLPDQVINPIWLTPNPLPPHATPPPPAMLGSELDGMAGPKNLWREPLLIGVK